jgi:colicin import membrane protein
MSHALRFEEYQEPGGFTSGVLAVLVHLLLVAFLVVGVSWQSSRPEAVVVELWDRAPAEEPEAPPPEPAPKVVEPPPAPKMELKLEPKLESKPVNPDIAVEREKKPKKEPKKAVQKKEEPLKLDPRQRINEELARELEAFKKPQPRPDAARAAAPALAAAPDAGYIDKIRTRIKFNIVLPPDIPGNPEAIFNVVQLPTGEVLQVKLQKSSGVPAYDDAVERAIWKSSPLPRPDKPDQFRRELTLKFRPQE